MNANKPIHEIKDVSNVKIFMTFTLLIFAIIGYVVIDKYMGTDVASTEENIVSKTGDDVLSDKDALKIASEKYYAAVATITNTKTDINKIYNLIKTTDVVLIDESLIESLNAFGAKTYAVNSSATVVSNYEEAITNNFSDDFIKNKILMPNGFIGKVNDDYYIVRDKQDNYFFKDVSLTLISKTTTELHYKAVITYYKTSCASAGSTYPSITCTDTNESDETDYKLVKDGNNWKISTFTINS